MNDSAICSAVEDLKERLFAAGGCASANALRAMADHMQARWSLEPPPIEDVTGIFRNLADVMDAQREAYEQERLAALQEATRMASVDLPEQTLYDGPPIRFRVSKAWLEAMLPMCEDGVAATWLTKLSVSEGDLCFAFTREPEEKT